MSPDPILTRRAEARAAAITHAEVCRAALAAGEQRPRPTAWDDQLIAALADRSRDLPPHLRRRGDDR
jgi:hypothetical protein